MADSSSLAMLTSCTVASTSLGNTSLEANGFCVIRGASKGISDHMIGSLESAVRARLDKVLEKVVEVGLDPIKDNFSFSEVCKRHSGARYDVSAAGSAFGGLYDELVAAVHEAVVSVLPASKVDRGGCVASLPGAPGQGWHIDGQQAGLVNAFVPLVDIDETNGTEFIPGSHDPQVEMNSPPHPSAPTFLPPFHEPTAVAKTI